MGRTVFGIVIAVVLHAAFLLFGGLLLPEAAASQANLQMVDLEPEAVEDKKPDEEPPEEKPPEVENKQEQAPDAAEVIRNLEQPTTDAAPALDAASLSAISDSLLGGGVAGDFGSAMNFASGGRIGGTGKAGDVDTTMEQAFSLGDLDQRPQALFKAEPVYPAEMRGKKVEGVVSVIFVVDATGKVADVKSEKSSHPAFEKPAIDAVKQWKFEPGTKAGKKVPAKMRVSIRFPK
jgi:protein TonB